MAYDVFISHASKDKAIADAVCAVLEREGIRCWIAPRDIRPGADWGHSLIQGIKASRAMVLVLSRAANTSPHILREVERAVHLGLPILPIRVEDVLPEGALEFHLGTVHWLDAVTPPLETHLARLAETLKVMPTTHQPKHGSKESASSEEGEALRPSREQPWPASLVEHLEQVTVDRLFVGRRIPDEKLDNAINAYASLARREHVFVLYDSTFRGSGKTGLLLTTTAVYWKNLSRPPASYRYEEIEDVKFNATFFSTTIAINGATIDIPIGAHKKIAELLAYAVREMALKARECPHGAQR